MQAAWATDQPWGLGTTQTPIDFLVRLAAGDFRLPC